MSVVIDLKRLREILNKLRESPHCVEVTGYDKYAIELFMKALDRAINRYVSEARRVRKYYR